MNLLPWFRVQRRGSKNELFQKVVLFICSGSKRTRTLWKEKLTVRGITDAEASVFCVFICLFIFAMAILIIMIPKFYEGKRIWPTFAAKQLKKDKKTATQTACRIKNSCKGKQRRKAKAELIKLIELNMLISCRLDSKGRAQHPVLIGRWTSRLFDPCMAVLVQCAWTADQADNGHNDLQLCSVGHVGGKEIQCSRREVALRLQRLCQAKKTEEGNNPVPSTHIPCFQSPIGFQCLEWKAAFSEIRILVFIFFLEVKMQLFLLLFCPLEFYCMSNVPVQTGSLSDQTWSDLWTWLVTVFRLCPTPNMELVWLFLLDGGCKHRANLLLSWVLTELFVYKRRKIDTAMQLLSAFVVLLQSNLPLTLFFPHSFDSSKATLTLKGTGAVRHLQCLICEIQQ